MSPNFPAKNLRWLPRKADWMKHIALRIVLRIVQIYYCLRYDTTLWHSGNVNPSSKLSDGNHHLIIQTVVVLFFIEKTAFGYSPYWHLQRTGILAQN